MMLSTGSTGWQRDAARIVEELFAVTRTQDWDLLLDLRQLLLDGSDWARALDVFLACRERMEEDHYLPFYRLRQLLAVSLRLEAVNTGLQPGPLGELLRGRHKSLADLKRRVRREWFEHLPELTEKVSLRVVESVPGTTVSRAF